jgi:quercetin dioxygenase-like cupin family protein
VPRRQTSGLQQPFIETEHTMYVIEQQQPQPTPIPGVSHATWAAAAEGLNDLSVWRQSLAAGACTPPHSHDCDEVVLCTGGWGEVHLDGKAHKFGADTTVVLPKGSVHQIFNVGPMPLEIVGIFAATPVATMLPDGVGMELPWRS